MFVLKKKSQLGFTLVELLVTISIFVILTGIVMFNQGKFNSTILLTNLAYDTALTIRQAQTYGINIKEFNGANQFVPYGVHFEKGGKSFILFADIGSNGIYDGSKNVCSSSYPGFQDGCVSRYNIQRGNYISDLCVDGTCGKTSLDIVFKRPNPDALIRANSDSVTLNDATIILGNPDGNIRKVLVQQNGLIQIMNQ